MRSQGWLPIRYRDFHDIPRAFVVEAGGETLLFDCAFNADLDEYPTDYRVFRLEERVIPELHSISWTDLQSQGIEMGRVPTAAVVFDQTKRSAIHASILDHLD